MRPGLHALRIRCGLGLAVLALSLFAFSPLVHGLIHGDHQIDALPAAHADAHKAHDHGNAHPGSSCGLYQLCLAQSHPGTAPPALVPPMALALGEPKPLPPAAPWRDIPFRPSARGPPVPV